MAVVATAAAVVAGTAFAGTEGPGHHHHGDAAIGAPAKAAAATRTVQVEMQDNLFVPDAIAVKAGETVRFVVRNGGEFLHEFNIGTAAMHAAHQKEMAAMAESGVLTATGMNQGAPHADHASGHEPAMAHDDPNSVLVEPGQTKELTWTFGSDAALEFACNVPGHYEAGMVGTITFTP